MSHDDLDRKLLEKLRWQSASSPEEVAKLLEDAQREAEPKAQAGGSTAKTRTEDLPAKSRAISDELAREVMALWAQPGEAQAAAVLSLAERVAEAGFFCFGFADHPLAAIRMIRLLLRHEDALPKDVLGRALLVLPSVVEPHPELGALLCELAESGNQALRFRLRLAKITDEVRFWPVFSEAAPRLAQILEEAADPEARVTAAELLGSAVSIAAVPALRRALRSRNLAVREAALTTLLAYDTTPLTGEDLCLLIEDTAQYPMPDGPGSYDLAYNWAELLEEALVALRPPGAVAPLERIARQEAPSCQVGNNVLDDGWALSMLAAAYPERALPLIDAALRNSRLWTRRDGVVAAARLPWELARPRLLKGATDGARRVAERAREAWRERQQASCPVAPTDGLCLELLEGPPSEELLLRLTILRGDADEAKRKLVPLLLAEAPSREALVLLLLVLEDDYTYCHGDHAVLPSPARELGPVITDRFGELATEGLVWLGRRYPIGFDTGFSLLEPAAKRDDASPAARARMRELAARSFAELAPGERQGPVELLSVLGAPPEVFPALLEEAVGGGHLGWLAATALGKSPEAEGTVVAALREAARAGDWNRLQVLANLVTGSRWESAREPLLEWMRQAPTEPAAAVEVAEQLGTALLGAGWLTEEEAFEWLAEPGRPGFLAVAAGWRPKAPEVLARLHAGLEAALDSPGLDGRAAGVAASRLLRDEKLAPEYPELLRILRAAPLDVRFQILGQRALHSECVEPQPMSGKFSLEQLWLVEGRRPRYLLTEPLEAEVLRAFADPAVGYDMAWSLVSTLAMTAEGRALLLRARAVCPLESVRSEIAEACKVPDETQGYWEALSEEE